jgi:hypothetical protein
MAKVLEVTEIFNELVRQGHISPVEQMEDLRMPGELPYVPSIATYGTPHMAATGGIVHAELEQRAERNFG